MKEFESLKFDIKQCINELRDFKALLDSKKELRERNDIIPFFKQKNTFPLI